VLLLYQNVLRRTPSQAELNAQLALLSSGTSRAQLAMNFLTSAEFFSRIRAEADGVSAVRVPTGAGMPSNGSATTGPT